MKKLILLTTFILSTTVASSASAGNLTASDEKRIKELAIEAILERPEIIEEAIARLRELQEQRQQQAVVETIEQRRQDFLEDPNAPVLGNPDGDVTVVEFFDYNCPYCKRAAEPVKKLVEADGNVRLVYREWPILGEGSLFAARAALAARNQGKYEEMHVGLMSGRRVDEAYTIKLAEKIGLDVKRLRKDMQAPEIKQHIELSMELAAGLGINGTPSFLVGNQLAPGLVPYEELVRMVENARGEKTK